MYLTLGLFIDPNLNSTDSSYAKTGILFSILVVGGNRSVLATVMIIVLCDDSLNALDSFHPLFDV